MSTATDPQAPATNGQLAKLDNKTVAPPPVLRDLLTRQMPDLERLYAPAMRAGAARLARAVVTEVAKNPQLARCSAMSLLSCAVQAAQLQLEIGGVLGQCYMVPYRNNDLGVDEAQFQIGYRGLLTLAFRSGRVKGATAQVVRQGDAFKVQYGTSMGILHEPAADGTRGEATHVYAVVSYHGGGVDFEVMTVPEVDEHRRKFSKQGKDRDGNRKGIWAAHFDPMARKTVLIKLLKRCPVGIDPSVLDEPEEAVAGEIAAAPADQPAPRQVAAARPADLEAVMVKKGVSPGDAAAWLNREFEANHDELPPVDQLTPAERQALAGYLAGLPDAAGVGS